MKQFYYCKIILTIGWVVCNYSGINAQDPSGFFEHNIQINSSLQRVSSTPLNIIHVIPSPTSGTSSLAFDGQYLWVGAYPDSVFKIRPTDGSVLKSLYTGLERPYGLAYVNGVLWIADNNTNTINKIDTATGNTLLSFNSFNQGYESGMAWDGTYLWHSDLAADSIYVFDTTGVFIKSAQLNIPVCHGITFQDSFLWAGDNGSHMLYKMDTVTFALLDTIVSPRQYPNGLAFDGQYLWVAENENSSGIDSIYQLGLGPVGIAEIIQQTEFSIFPNPSSGTFHGRLNEIADEVNVFNTEGQLVRKFFPGGKEFSFSISDNGIYFLEIKTLKRVIPTKILVFK